MTDDSERHRSPGRSVWPAVTVMAVGLLLGLQGVGFWLFRDRGPTPDEHREAAAYLRAAYRDGDLIFLVPAYATEAREYLGDLGPRAVRDPLLEDVEPYHRMWSYTLFGEETKLEGRLRGAGHELETRQTFPGGIVVDRYRLEGPASAVRWSLLEDFEGQPPGRKPRVLSGAFEVEHHRPDGKIDRCDRWLAGSKRGGPGGRFQCPHDGDWLYVGPEWHFMGERPRRCLWAHPPQDGRLMVRIQDVPLAGTLYLRGGHTLNASKRAQAPVYLDVSLVSSEGTTPEQRFRFELEDTWRPYRMRTPTTGTATLTLAVSSPNNGANHFCFVADTRATGPRGRRKDETP